MASLTARGTIASLADETILQRPPRSLWGDAWRQFRRHRLAVAGVIVLVLLGLATVLGPLGWRASITATNYGIALQAPSAAHPFGTDDLGRDLLARTLRGGRVSLTVGLAAMLIAITVGVLVGSLAGFFGGRTDSLLMRLTDLFLALPQLPLLLVVIYLFRDSLRGVFGPIVGIFLLVVFVIGILNWMPVARLVRAEFLSLKEKEFTEAARCLGARNGRIIFRHIMPNVLSPVIVAATLAVGSAIITESALSFLGLGFPPDEPTWGRLLYDAQNYLELAPHLAIIPGILIFLTVIAVNYMGDGLRDALDPRRTKGN